LYSRLVLLNVGSVDCTLPSPTTVELRDGGGALLFSRDTSVAALEDAAMAPGGTAIAQLSFADWCIALPATPLRLDVVLSGGRVPVVPSALPGGAVPVPPCMAAPATPPPAFGVDALSSPAFVEPPPSDPGDALPVAVAASVPASVAAGSDLRYLVTLTNTDAKGAPVQLPAACPSFVQRLFLPDKREVSTRDLLSCDAAGTIESGGRRTFEMRIAVPPDATAGGATLLWQLGDRGANSPKIPIEITAP
jgi:hypothetical protein